MISQHWFRWWLGVIRQQAITWTNVDPDLCRQNELICDMLEQHVWVNQVSKTCFLTDFLIFSQLVWCWIFSVDHWAPVSYVLQTIWPFLNFRNIFWKSGVLGIFPESWKIFLHFSLDHISVPKTWQMTLTFLVNSSWTCSRKEVLSTTIE